MTTAVLTPFVGRQGSQPGNRLWRKMLLPVGEVEYKGRTLKFTPNYLHNLVQSFKSGAYDQVPFQLADGSNTHTNDPERYRGEVRDMVLEPDGLYITAAVTPEGDTLLRTNPKLGISARIVEDYDRADRQHFPAAIQHVLGTLDPRIPGMGGWQAIEQSNLQMDSFVDLSSYRFAGEDGDMPEMNAEQQARLARLLEIPADKFEALIEGLTMPELTEEELAALGGEGEDEGDQLTDAELEELLAAAEELDAAGALEPAGLSAADVMGIELANARADENHRQLERISSELDEQRFITERRKLADGGIPPFITDLAKPLLCGTGRVIEFSNGDGSQSRVDAGQVMRRVLTEVGKMAKMFDLGVEMGSPMDEPEGNSRAEEQRADIVARFRDMTKI